MATIDDTFADAKQFLLGGATPEEGEWPKRDAVPEIEWRAEMVQPGFVYFIEEPKIPITPKTLCGHFGVDAIAHIASKYGLPGSPTAIPETPVTSEMVEAGFSALLEDSGVAFGVEHFSVEEAVERVYRAMAALAPVPLVTDGELAAVRERDELLRIVERDTLRLEEAFRERDALDRELQDAHGDIDTFHLTLTRREETITTLRAQLAVAQETVTRAEALARENARLQMTVAARDQAIAGLKSQLATRPEPTAEPPKPTPNAFRDFTTDPRRIGP